MYIFVNLRLLQDVTFSSLNKVFPLNIGVFKIENSEPIASNFASTSENTLLGGLAVPDYNNCGIRIQSSGIKNFTEEGVSDQDTSESIKND